MTCPPPEDCTIDFTLMTKQMRLNADFLMKDISDHALNEREKMQLEIDMINAKIVYLEQILEATIRKLAFIQDPSV